LDRPAPSDASVPETENVPMRGKLSIGPIAFLLCAALGCSGEGQAAQDHGLERGDAFAAALPLGSSDELTIAAIEAEGSAFPRGGSMPWDPWYAQLEGTSARECVPMPIDTLTARRSGDFAVGGGMLALAEGRRAKVWWKPRNSATEMELLVRGRRLGSGGDTLRFQSVDLAGSRESETLEWIPESMFFPSGFTLPLPGTWVVVATSGSDWGCFMLRRS
jgi:hypothetical protein